jgi:hypothetical protein
LNRKRKAVFKLGVQGVERKKGEKGRIAGPGCRSGLKKVGGALSAEEEIIGVAGRV